MWRAYGVFGRVRAARGKERFLDCAGCHVRARERGGRKHRPASLGMTRGREGGRRAKAASSRRAPKQDGHDMSCPTKEGTRGWKPVLQDGTGRIACATREAARRGRGRRRRIPRPKADPSPPFARQALRPLTAGKRRDRVRDDSGGSGASPATTRGTRKERRGISLRTGRAMAQRSRFARNGARGTGTACCARRGEEKRRQAAARQSEGKKREVEGPLATITGRCLLRLPVLPGRRFPQRR